MNPFLLTIVKDSPKFLASISPTVSQEGESIMSFNRIISSLVLALSIAPIDCAEATNLNVENSRIVDLTHALNSKSVFWPTAPLRFEQKKIFAGVTPAGFFYSAFSMCLAEHGGTHLDAPVHFSKTGKTASEVPLERLVGFAVVLDVSAKAQADRDYRLTLDDVKQFESVHGEIPQGSIVLLRTDYSKRWPDEKAYLGDDTKGDDSRLHFPSLGEEAVKFLIHHRAIKAIGVDVASIDYGMSRDFRVHQVLASHDVPSFENLANLDQLPAKGAFVVALPTKIDHGSGGPLRIIALVEDSNSKTEL